MPRNWMSFCPSRPVMAAAFVSLLRLCAMQVAVGQASRTSRTFGAHGGTSAVAAGQATARRSEGDTFFRGAGQAGQERSLADEGCSGDEEGQLFVDSLITNLKNPIGGCYEISSMSNSSTSEYPSYALGGGGPTKGQSWIYATNSGVWVIGIVDDIVEATGEVSSKKTVCSSIIKQADELSGPTDSQLNGIWICSYFEAGKTNYVEADFEGVECGCGGRSTPTQSSGRGDYSSTAIAIATLTALVALLVLVCLCLFHLKKRKPPIQHEDSEPKEDSVPTKEDALAPAEDALKPEEDPLAGTEDALASKENPFVSTGGTLVPTEDALSPDGDTLETKEDTLASAEDTLEV